MEQANIWYHIGLTLLVLAVIASVLGTVLLLRSKKHLNRILDTEYGTD